MSLPILQHRDSIIDSIRTNQVTIVIGETGSGKTTEIPRFLYEAGFGEHGVIGITEPRRIAAISVARFVAQNLGTSDNETVAHKVRFDDTTHADTKVKFMTDGVLLREIHDDPLLRRYSVIMIDEAHERSANIDFLMGLVKKVLAERPELRVVVTSATIDSGKFSAYFGGAPVIKVDGRLHDVEVIYWGDSAYGELTKNIVMAVEKALGTSSSGDILVFLTGADEIDQVSNAMGVLRGSYDIEVLPAHGSLTPEEQGRIFETYPGKRKVVLATNIAETSITIDGVVYVIDAGRVKQIQFDSISGIQSLDTVKHSRAGCEQRKGRAGRTQPGICYRLFSKEDYGQRPAFTEPELLRMSLAGIVLAMEALEIQDIMNFDFIDPPDPDAFHEAYRILEALGAIESGKPGLTDIGHRMATLPLEPRISRMVIEAAKYNCVENVATIAAFMSATRSVFARPKNKEWEADDFHRRFKNGTSDALTFLNVWAAYEAAQFDKDWCFEHFLVHKTLREIGSVRDQLLKQLGRSGVRVSRTDDESLILRSVATGLAYNLIHYYGYHQYVGIARDLGGVFVHPSSSTFGYNHPSWMVASEIIDTSKRFARVCSIVKPEWLPDVAPALFYFGKPVLEDYTPGNDYVTTSTPILRNDGSTRSVGLIMGTLPIHEARVVQDASIAKVISGGLKLLTAVRPEGSFGLKGRDDAGNLYIMSSMGALVAPKEGARYYCSVTPSMATSVSGSQLAYPMLRVFDLPSEAAQRRVYG